MAARDRAVAFGDRDAKYYAITRAGVRALESQTERWRRLAGLVNKLLLHEP